MYINCTQVRVSLGVHHRGLHRGQPQQPGWARNARGRHWPLTRSGGSVHFEICFNSFTTGTSDTVFVWLSEPKPQLTGHVWPNPVDEDAFMALLCYKNGSLTRFGWILSLIFSICQLSYNDSSRCHNAQIRERVRDTCADSSWSMFDELLNSTTRGNYGNLGL